MLNVPELFKSVKKIADTLHQHKKLLYFNIPRFKETKDQNEILKLSKECSKIVEEYINNEIKIKLTEINDLINDKLTKIRELGLKILSSKEGTKMIKKYEFQD